MSLELKRFVMSLPGLANVGSIPSTRASRWPVGARTGRLARVPLVGRTPHIEVVNFVVIDGDPVFRIGVIAPLAALGRAPWAGCPDRTGPLGGPRLGAVRAGTPETNCVGDPSSRVRAFSVTIGQDGRGGEPG